MSRETVTPTFPAARSAAERLRIQIGIGLRDERRRRGLTLRHVAEAAGLDFTTIRNVEIGRPASLEVIERIAAALKLQLSVDLTNPRRRAPSLSVDPVHSAMGEIEAEHFQELGFTTLLDEPYQHYQFAGRGDSIAFSLEDRTLLVIENRTMFPDLEDAMGSFGAKRAYLGRELALRLGIPGWKSECHVIVALWSAEVLHTLRLRKATFRSACPDGAGPFERWWAGNAPPSGVHSGLVVFDPLEGVRSDRLRWLGLDDLAGARPRYRDYADALGALKEADRC